VSTYSLTHLSDPVLLRDLASLVAQDRATTAKLLAHIAECDARRLYLQQPIRRCLPTAWASCVFLKTPPVIASAGRVAREFPAIFEAVADGRLHLSAVRLLGPACFGDQLRISMSPGTTGPSRRTALRWSRPSATASKMAGNSRATRPAWMRLQAASSERRSSPTQ